MISAIPRGPIRICSTLASALTREELERDLRISHTSILSTLRHIYDGERVWLLGLRDTPNLGAYLLPQDPAPELSLDALKQSWLKLWDGYVAGSKISPRSA